MDANLRIKSVQWNSSKNQVASITLESGEVCIAGGNISENVSPVTSNVTPGEIESGKKITLSCATEGATIFYTKDGTEPSMASTRYSSKITINEDTTIKAVAYKDGCNTHAVSVFEYTIAN